MIIVFLCAAALGWVGHACLWTALLNNLYGRPWHKGLLKLWRFFTALILLAYPLLLSRELVRSFMNGNATFNAPATAGEAITWGYLALCLFVGALVLPAITIARLLRPRPASLREESTRTLDLWPLHGRELIGDNRLAAVTRLPGNCVFQMEFTNLTLALEPLPEAWHGLTVLIVSDLHFQGTPSWLFFERIFDELQSQPMPDLICLLGDYLDNPRHHAWIEPLLSRLQAREGKLAILGNHDSLHEPDQVRAELAQAGFTVLGNTWREITIRGERCVVISHEGPWFRPEPDLTAAPTEPFRLCLSHTPDNFYWGIVHHINLMMCGHVHGGGIRVPVIGPIFVPSRYGRRFDSGVYEKQGTTMVVGRGISGKEPLRLRCRPQIIRLTLIRP